MNGLAQDLKFAWRTLRKRPSFVLTAVVSLALGARPIDVLRAVVADGTKLVATGMAAGVGLSLIVTPLLTAHVFAVKANQPIVIAAACAALALVAASAMLAPSRKACKIQALAVLRHE